MQLTRIQYDATKVANLFQTAQRQGKILQITTLRDNVFTIRYERHILQRFVRTDKGRIPYAQIKAHKFVSDRNDDLGARPSDGHASRHDEADLIEFTAFNVDSGIELKHFEIEPGTGFLRFIAPIARTGDLVYLDDSGCAYTEYVPPQTLIDSIPTVKGKPITDGHPFTKLDRNSASQYTKGSTHSLAFFDSSWLWTGGTVFDGQLIDGILNKEKSEISLGYSALVKNQDGKLTQVKRDVNHLAAVRHGRNGREIGFKVDNHPIMTLRLDSVGRDPIPPDVMLEYLRVSDRKLFI